MKKLALLVWSLTMVGVATVSVGVLCAGSWISGLMTGVICTDQMKDKEDTNEPEEDKIINEEVM